MAKQKPFEQAHQTITCIDCGAERTVRNQDVHQVVRCATCQRTHRIQRRSELRRLQKENMGE